MVLYTIKNLLPVKDILKTLPSSDINKNWRNKNLKIILFDVDVLIRKLDQIFKLGQLIGCLVRNISIEKVYRKHALKASAIPLYKACVCYF